MHDRAGREPRGKRFAPMSDGARERGLDARPDGTKGPIARPRGRVDDADAAWGPNAAAGRLVLPETRSEECAGRHDAPAALLDRRPGSRFVMEVLRCTAERWDHD